MFREAWKSNGSYDGFSASDSSSSTLDKNKIAYPRLPKYLTALIIGALGIRVSSAAACLRGSVTKCHSTSYCFVVEKRAWGLRLTRAIIQQNERQCLQARQFFQLDN